MSKQRPYGTFEEAYVLLLNLNDNQLYTEFMNELHGFNELGKEGKATRMRLPSKFLLSHDEYVIFWQCLSRMYGEVFENPVESYVYTCNLDAMIYSLEQAYNSIVDVVVYDHDYSFVY